MQSTNFYKKSMAAVTSAFISLIAYNIAGMVYKVPDNNCKDSTVNEDGEVTNTPDGCEWDCKVILQIMTTLIVANVTLYIMFFFVMSGSTATNFGKEAAAAGTGAMLLLTLLLASIGLNIYCAVIPRVKELDKHKCRAAAAGTAISGGILFVQLISLFFLMK